MVVRNYIDKSYSSAEAKRLKQRLVKTNTLNRTKSIDIPNRFNLRPNGIIVSRINSQPIARLNSATSGLKSNFDLYHSKSVLNQINIKNEFKDIAVKKLFTDKRVAKIIKDSAFLTFLQSNASASTKNNKELLFNLHEVKCIEETRNEWGTDEIVASAITVDDKGTSGIVNEFLVSNRFRDNYVKQYVQPRIIKKFSLNQDTNYPKRFMVNLFMAEKDFGGFSKLISDLYSAIEAELEIILALAGGAAGTAIAAGPLGTAAGAIVGIAAGIILDALVGWMVQALKDDPLMPTPQDPILIQLDSPNFTFDGSLNSPIMTMDFYGPTDGSHYCVKYNWEIEQ